MGELPTRVQEQDPLLGPTPPTPTRPSRKPVLAAFAGALLVGLGYVVGFKDGKTGSTLSATDGWAFAPIADNRSGRDSSTLMATNEMIDHYGAEGQDYPWMDGLLVEPHYETTFVSSNTAKVWTVTSAETGEVVASSTATQFVHTFTAVGKFYITTDADDSGTVHVKYVRREIRSMTTAARLKLFEAWHVVIKEKDEKVAREKYGDDFTSLRKLAALHNNWAGAQECDHLHDGMGFITTHVAMNRIFELSLQSVDPSVSLPYWEYTVDVERVIDEENGNFQHWKDLEIWSDKYFGYTNPETGTIETGIFADIDMFADPLYSTVVNSYGLIRSPWNTLATDKVVRFQGSGGASTQKTEGVVCPDAVGLPTCSNLYDVLNTSKTILDFTRLSSMQAHGPIHLLTGGIGGQPDYINFFKNELGLSPVSAPSFPEAWNHVTEFFFVVARAAYRYGLLRIPDAATCSNGDETDEFCLASCDAGEIMASDMYADVFQLYAYTDTFTDPELTKLVSYFCKGKAVYGDHATSSAVADPSFFSMHGAVERYLDLARLKGLFLEQKGWPDRDHCLWRSNIHPGSDSCAGHYGDDELLFGAVDGATYTNERYYNYLDPTTGSKPYVYDNFAYPHCAALGYDINGITRSATFASSH